MMASAEPDADLQKACAAAETPCKETSPDSKCPICLDRFRNLAYADRCFHRFCFRCILEWGKNKAECPLCKQPFGSVYHSVRSEDDFKLYELRPAENGSFGCVQGQRFRYRTTLTHERRREGRTRGRSLQQEVMRFRRWLYRRGVRVRGVRDSGRSRDTSAEFFRKNPACLHRLVPWLKRELAVLYGSHDSVADVVLHVILSLITRHDMQDEAFLRELRPFLSSRTEHFLHEFLSFAKSPFNMEAYDRHAVYDCPAPSHLPAVSEDDADLGSAPSPWDDETPGPSYSSATQSVFTVTISDSDVDSASEEEETVSVNANAAANINVSSARVDEDDHSSDGDCVIIGFIKPTSQRTPELVQLSSDSEASVQEGPSTSNQSDARDLTNRRSRNTDDVPSHSATKHSKSKHRDRDRDRDYSSHGHRQRSRSLSYKDRRRSKATNHSSPSHTRSHTRSHTQHRRSRYYSRDTPRRSRARSRAKTHSRSRSRTHSFSRTRTRARSRSKTRARSPFRTHTRSWTTTRARSGSRTHGHSGSRTRARSGSRTHGRSGSRTRARSGSRTRARSYSGSWRTQASLQNRKRSERLSVSPSPSSHRRSSHDKPCRKKNHKSLHGERRRRSRENHHHPKKKKKRRRRSSSTEVGAERRKHHKKKKKHKRERKNRSERMGRGSGAGSPTFITIHTDSESAEEATPPRDAAATNSESLSSSNGAPTSCPTCANTTSHNGTASDCASHKTLTNDSATVSTSSHAPSNITPPNDSPQTQTSRASNPESARHASTPLQSTEAALLL
ncbi:topoisomerase I binding, arginine/serine-rich a [Pangasianodon hypophthalmus]|uniref:topoisomerase I binding, arginine/serine-rich a n=1 Tax=Pangasianodon hypophthalmus TaxID=310915 RepID=UPI0023082690|nr:topoisomerase I binding, arginine/serine-rich a [Pangasianodon hypophthalmus]